MKTYYKAIITLAISLLYITANAQWYKLRPYTTPFVSDSNLYITYVLPYAAGNGVILYGIIYDCNFLHCGGEVIMESQDDLNTCKQVFSDGEIGSGYIFSIVSRNDSTHCFIYSNDSTYIKYTSDNFKTISNINTSRLFGYNGAPSSISPNFIYSTWQNPYIPGEDSLLIEQFSISSAAAKGTLNAKYSNSTNILFTSDSIGYMTCCYRNDSAKSVLVRTADSGKTWTDIYLDSVHTITSFCFSSSNIGYLTKSNGDIYKTTNAGASWFKLSSPTSSWLNCVSFANDSVGYVGGNNGVLYKTINGGITWTTANSGITNNISALYTFGDSIAYFKDANNNLYKNVSPMGIQNISSTTPTIAVYPNPSKGLFNIHIANGQRLLANSCIKVYNLFGENIATIGPMPSEGEEWTLNLSTQPSGVYFYRIIDIKGNSLSTGKLILSK